MGKYYFFFFPGNSQEVKAVEIHQATAATLHIQFARRLEDISVFYSDADFQTIPLAWHLREQVRQTRGCLCILGVLCSMYVLTAPGTRVNRMLPRPRMLPQSLWCFTGDSSQCRTFLLLFSPSFFSCASIACCWLSQQGRTLAGSQRMLDVLEQFIKQPFPRGLSPAAAGGARYPRLHSYRGIRR